jgi:hypothetical protein
MTSSNHYDDFIQRDLEREIARQTNCAILLTRSLRQSPADPLHSPGPTSPLLQAARSRLLLAARHAGPLPTSNSYTRPSKDKCLKCLKCLKRWLFVNLILLANFC